MDYRIEEFIKHFLSDISKTLKITKVAKSYNLSASRFRHLFLAEMTVSITQYIKDERLKKAIELLETTEMLIKQICAVVGIDDEGRFAKEFKKKHKVTPTEYRRNFRTAKNAKK